MRIAGIDRQASFAAAVLDPEAAVPAFVRAATGRRAASGLAVYRNNVAAGLINVVAVRFPTVRRLAGDDSFLACARRFVVAHPPRSPLLLHYGEAFPSFVRGLGRAGCFAYLADVAELELARGRAYHAADAVPVALDAFTAPDPGMLGDLRLTLHPSVTLLRSRFPIVSVWQEIGCGEAQSHINCGPEDALVARPALDVEVWKLPPGGFVFLSALAEGQTLAASAGQAAAAAAAFDLAANLALLIGSGIITGLR
jgi:hypothetical protein